jgi:hypothetical protein
MSGGLLATLVIPQFIKWIPYDYAVYMEGARMIRAGLNPYSKLPYWYPLPITLFTTVPWSYLPDQFAWAFAFIPAGLLHLRYGRRAILWWLFFPFLINLAYAQAEGWLVLPLIWLLEDVPQKASFAIVGLLFKPAYAVLLAPYRVIGWLQEQRLNDLRWVFGLVIAMFSAAFIVQPNWLVDWFDGVIHRGDNPELQLRNMTVWAFPERGYFGIAFLVLFLLAFAMLSLPLWRSKERRGDVLLAASLCFFPGGLNPVSSMMVMPMVNETYDIIALVVVSWIAAGLDILAGGFGGVYLLIILAALALRVRRLRAAPSDG